MMLMTDWMILASRKAGQIYSKGPVSSGYCCRECWDRQVCRVVVGLGRLEGHFRLHPHHPYRRAIYKVARCREMAGFVEDQVDPSKPLPAQQQCHQRMYSSCSLARLPTRWSGS